MRDACRVRRRERSSGVRDHPRGPVRLERPLRKQVGEGVAGRPLHDDVGVIPVVLDVEDLGEPGVGQPAGRASRGNDIANSRESGGKCEDGDRSGEGFVNGLPCIPASAGGYPVLEPVTAAELGAWRGRIRRHGVTSAELLQALDASSWLPEAGVDNSMMRHNLPACSAATLPVGKPLPARDHRAPCGNAGPAAPAGHLTGAVSTAPCPSGR